MCYRHCACRYNVYSVTLLDVWDCFKRLRDAIIVVIVKGSLKPPQIDVTQLGPSGRHVYVIMSTGKSHMASGRSDHQGDKKSISQNTICRSIDGHGLYLLVVVILYYWGQTAPRETRRHTTYG
jgi:hypothetical protein